jgi:hypothetical protein
MSYSIYLRDGSGFIIEVENLKKLKAFAQSEGFDTVDDYFGDYGFRLEIQKGKAGGILFDGDRMPTDIEAFLESIAPFVSPDSYIEMEGEDGSIWRWVFDGKTYKEQQGKISFE